MALVYDDVSARGKFEGTPVHLWGPERVMRTYKTHVENRAFLSFMSRKGTLNEKLQANKELEICTRKITFFERHPAFDRAWSVRIINETRSAWAGK